MLSKGMSQKIQFIAAVVANPELVILDEPFSGLDPVNLNVIRDAVLELREHGTTVIFSTHDMAVAERMCDTIFMIFQGKKVLDGTLQEIQAMYPANRIRVAFDQPAEELPALPAVSEIQRAGRFFEMTVEPGVTPQHVLARLIDARPVAHFEVIRPSLHDIFVHIAQPEDPRSVAVASGATRGD
jgi:ABC-2 type transport system ATP-binding protein